MQYNEIQCNTMKYSVILCNIVYYCKIVQYNEIQCNSMKYSGILFNIVQGKAVTEAAVRLMHLPLMHWVLHYLHIII